MNKIIPLFFVLFLHSANLWACSCAVVSFAFCESIQAWSINNPIVLAVKIDDVQAEPISGGWSTQIGMRVAVLEQPHLSVSADTLVVWGQDGLNCLEWLTPFNDGDTLLMSISSSSIEVQEPTLNKMPFYELNGCGRYFIRYQNGQLIGNIYSENPNETVVYDDFAEHIADECLDLSIEPIEPLLLHQTKTELHFTLPNAWQQAQIQLFDANGRLVSNTHTTTQQQSLAIEHLPQGIYILQCTHENKHATAKWIKY